LPPVVYGWKVVKRNTFEAIYLDEKNMVDIAINVSLLVDA